MKSEVFGGVYDWKATVEHARKRAAAFAEKRQQLMDDSGKASYLEIDESYGEVTRHTLASCDGICRASVPCEADHGKETHRLYDENGRAYEVEILNHECFISEKDTDEAF